MRKILIGLLVAALAAGCATSHQKDKHSSNHINDNTNRTYVNNKPDQFMRVKVQGKYVRVYGKGANVRFTNDGVVIGNGRIEPEKDNIPLNGPQLQFVKIEAQPEKSIVRHADEDTSPMSTGIDGTPSKTKCSELENAIDGFLARSVKNHLTHVNHSVRVNVEAINHKAMQYALTTTEGGAGCHVNIEWYMKRNTETDDTYSYKLTVTPKG